MNRFLRSLTAPALAIAATMAAVADAPMAPPVPADGFHCFPGMQTPPAPSAPRNGNILRGPKLGNSKWDNTDGHDLREVPTEGKLKVLVILVSFEDVNFTQDKKDPRGLIDNMLNGDNFTFQGATGSANAFYRAVSDGLFDPQFDVYGPVKLPKITREYAGSTYIDVTDPVTGEVTQKYPPSMMVEEAVRALDDEINYADYDTNKDGLVDFVYIFHSGLGATTGGAKDRNIWPHAFTLEAGIGAPIELDGVKINRYATSSELYGLDKTARLSGIGTFCHEFGHVLGLPDLYDTNNNGSAQANFTPGTFSCMDAGNYNNNEHTPPFFSAYEQYSLEWMLPTVLKGGGDFTMLPLSARKHAYKVETTRPQEYFLLEARDMQSYDHFLECHGLAVWHIDFDKNVWDKNAPNNIDAHHRIDLIEADNTRDRDSRNGDLFPGAAGKCEYRHDISPSFIDWNQKPTGYSLTEIKRNFDGTVSFICTSEDGKIMEGSEIAAPRLELMAVGADKISVRFPAIDGADSYYISAYPMADFDGAFVTKYADGYYYRPATATDGYVEMTIEGLAEGASYGIMAYAVNNVNASRTAAPLVVATVAQKFEDAVTNMFGEISDDAKSTFLSWNAVEGATSYDLTVARRLAENGAEEIEKATEAFDSKRMPEGWSGNGNFDRREKYCGAAVPSYQLTTTGSYLQTARFDNQIKEVSFWSRKRSDKELCHLEVFGVDADGRMLHAANITDLAREGKRHTVEMPAGSYAVKFVYFMQNTGLDCNIDDIEISFAESFTDLPVAEASIEMTDATHAVVRGLEPTTKYVAYVTPKRGEEVGKRSNTLSFTVSGLPVSGVESIIDDNIASSSFSVIDGKVIAASDLPFDIFSIDGTVIARNVNGSFQLPGRGLYIISSADANAKICW